MSVVQLRGAVDGVVAASPEELSDAALADEVVAVRAEMDRLEAQFARLAHAAHRRGIGAAEGSPSTAAWLRRRTGMREGEARVALEAGAVCGDVLHATGQAWRAGEITSGAARTIVAARVEGHDAKLAAIEPVLLDLARDRATRELRRACAHFRHCATAEGTEPRAHDGLTLSRTYGGRTVLSAELSEIAAETVVTAIHVFTDPPAEGDDRTPARRRADALVRISETALATLGRQADRARTRATIVVNWTTLTSASDLRLRRRHRCGGPWWCATAGAGSRAVTDPPAGATRTTWSTGAVAAGPTGTTSCCSATIITTSCTDPAGSSSSTATTCACSDRTVPRSRDRGRATDGHSPGVGPSEARAPASRARRLRCQRRPPSSAARTESLSREIRSCTHRSSPRRRIHGLKHSYRSVKCTRVRPSPRSSSRVDPSARDHNGLPTASYRQDSNGCTCVSHSQD